MKGFINIVDNSAVAVFVVEQNTMIYQNKKCKEVMTSCSLIEEETKLNPFLIKTIEEAINGRQDAVIQSDTNTFVIKAVKQGALTYVYASDITELYKLREEYSAKMKIEETNQRLVALGEMAAGIGHEIKNPAHIIINQIENLRAKAEEGDACVEDIEECSQEITTQIENIIDIINSLKTLTRDGASDAKCKVKVRDILKDLCLFKAKARANFVELERDCTFGEDTLLNCKRVQLVQVLNNLFNNAFDSVIEHRTTAERKVTLVIEETDSSVIFKVKDNGTKIPEEVKNKLFTPLFTTKAPGKGTGLGLSISAKIALDHGGKLYLDKEEEETTFVFEIPKAA